MIGRMRTQIQGSSSAISWKMERGCYPEFVAFFVNEVIDSISLNLIKVIVAVKRVAKTENKPRNAARNTKEAES